MPSGTTGDRSRQLTSGHSDDAHDVFDRMLRARSVRSQHIELPSGQRVHVVDAGEGIPVFFLHGTGTSSLSLLPVFAHLHSVHAIAVDRPGCGLSDPIDVPRERFRAAAVEFVDAIMSRLELDRPIIAGNSMGGTWALWYAIARSEKVRRLILLGSAPLLPGTRPPAAVRVISTPLLGDLLSRLKTNRKLVVRFMSAMGEKETIVRYPDLIDALVAADNDPIASRTSLAEFRAILGPLGFRRQHQLRRADLAQLSIPVLVIWGDHDPLGTVDAAREATALLPNARLEVLPGGHVPYLGNPERAAQLITEFAAGGVG